MFGVKKTIKLNLGIDFRVALDLISFTFLNSSKWKHSFIAFFSVLRKSNNKNIN